MHLVHDTSVQEETKTRQNFISSFSVLNLNTINKYGTKYLKHQKSLVFKFRFVLFDAYIS